MRRLFFAILCVMGLGVTTEASAQVDLSKALDSFINSVSTSAAQLVPTVTDHYAVLRENAPTKSKVVGSWQYLSSRVEYLGSNYLASVAIPQLESIVSTELRSNGIVEGCCSLTLNRRGSAVVATRTDKFEGDYTYDVSKAKFQATYVYDNHTYKVSGYLKMVKSRLCVLVNMRDILRELMVYYPSLANDENYILIKSIVDSFGDLYLSILFKM